jgi:hypothetical protein
LFVSNEFVSFPFSAGKKDNDDDNAEYEVPSTTKQPTGKQRQATEGNLDGDHRELLSKLQKIAQAADGTGTGAEDDNDDDDYPRQSRSKKHSHRVRRRRRQRGAEKAECGTDVPLLDNDAEDEEQQRRKSDDESEGDEESDSDDVEMCDASTQTSPSDFPSPRTTKKKKTKNKKAKDCLKSVGCDAGADLGDMVEETSTTVTTVEAAAAAFPFIPTFTNGEANFGHRVDRLFNDIGSNVVVRRFGVPLGGAQQQHQSPQVFQMDDISPARLNFDRRSQQNFARSPEERLMAAS